MRCPWNYATTYGFTVFDKTVLEVIKTMLFKYSLLDIKGIFIVNSIIDIWSVINIYGIIIYTYVIITIELRSPINIFIG